LTAISTSGLTKRFRGGQLAVDHIDLAVPHGSVYGFLGPNGSGKTTTIRMLLGLIYPTSGRHELLGTPMPDGAVRVLPRVGSLVEGPAFYPFLNGQQNLARRHDSRLIHTYPRSPRGLAQAGQVVMPTRRPADDLYGRAELVRQRQRPLDDMHGYHR